MVLVPVLVLVEVRLVEARLVEGEGSGAGQCCRLCRGNTVVDPTCLLVHGAAAAAGTLLRVLHTSLTPVVCAFQPTSTCSWHCWTCQQHCH
jgi:hypothetical protein